FGGGGRWSSREAACEGRRLDPMGLRQCGPQDSNLQPRDSRAPAFPRGSDYLTLPRASLGRPRWRPGARRRGLSLGLTLLLPEPPWPPEPAQAGLRIAVPIPHTENGLGPPQFARIASGGYPPAQPLDR